MLMIEKGVLYHKVEETEDKIIAVAIEIIEIRKEEYCYICEKKYQLKPKQFDKVKHLLKQLIELLQ